MERPYRLITRLDPPPPQTDPASPSASSPASSPALSPVPCRRFVARDATGDRTVHLTAPLPGTDPALFRGEAETAQRLALPWTFPVTEIGGGTVGSEAWFATPYVPALPLPVALAVHGGPLPLETGRRLRTYERDDTGPWAMTARANRVFLISKGKVAALPTF
ncbi:hypothetical protein [Streptomyces sp. NPDC013740]|uniref:hypothetical protein n=1 Tax=Streptomyces sp. NPDC013740 TaxID=3364867 RepID=UPI0036F66E8B